MYADRAAIVDIIRALADGSGWVNVRPDVDPDDVPQQPSGMGLFSARGPIVPLGTISPSGPVKRGVPRVSLGLLHGLGRKAVPALAEAGVAVDPAWRLLQDHPRRGLVID